MYNKINVKRDDNVHKHGTVEGQKWPYTFLCRKILFQTPSDDKKN